MSVRFEPRDCVTAAATNNEPSIQKPYWKALPVLATSAGKSEERYAVDDLSEPYAQPNARPKKM